MWHGFGWVQCLWFGADLMWTCNWFEVDVFDLFGFMLPAKSKLRMWPDSMTRPRIGSSRRAAGAQYQEEGFGWFGFGVSWVGGTGLDLNWVGIDSNAFGIEFDWCCVDVGWTIVGLDWYGIGIDWFGLSVVDLALIRIEFAWIWHGFPWMFVCFWLCFWWVLVLKSIHCNHSAYILNMFHCLSDLAFQNGFSAGA